MVFIATSNIELQDHVNSIEMALRNHNMLINVAICKARVMINTDETLQIMIEAGDREKVKYY